MEEMEPITEILARLMEKHPRLAQTLKPLNSNKTCRGSYDWLLPEDLNRHMAEIVRIEDRRELCRDCTGDCQQNTKGYYDVVSPTSLGLFHCTMVLCEHARARREQTRLNHLIQSGGIPKAYAGKTIGDYITSEAKGTGDDLQSQRILSRICGMCHIVEVGGGDFRMGQSSA